MRRSRNGRPRRSVGGAALKGLLAGETRFYPSPRPGNTLCWGTRLPGGRTAVTIDDATRQRIEKIIGSDRVVLFMKGSRQMPQCGFSATVVQILDTLVPEYTTVDVLADPRIREGIKDYSSWPTIPQLYVGGEFLGGCDIVKEMYASGELQKKLGVEEAPVAPPSITLDDGAAKAIRAADDGSGEMLRLGVSAELQYETSF